VVHRDIKPANVLLLDGKPVIADFGIALAVGMAGGGRLTETGISVGTPFYMSPEQATGDQHVGPASDIYSLAAMLYEMLTGDPPYVGSTAQAVLGKIIQGGPASAKEIRKSVPENVDAAIRKGLETLPADRFAGAQEFANALADPAFRHGDATARVAAGAGVWNRATIAFASLFLLAAFTAVWALTGRSGGMSEPGVTRDRIAIGVHPLAAFRAILTPDGAAIIYWDTVGCAALWIKREGEVDPQRIAGTEDASGFAAGPGAFVHFGVGGQLKRVDTDEGLVTTVKDVAPDENCCGVMDDGRYLSFQLDTLRLSDFAGGDTVLVPSPEELQGRRDLWFMSQPQKAPVVFIGAGGTLEGSAVYALDLETGRASRVYEAPAAWWIDEENIALPRRDGSVVVSRFDRAELALAGEPALLVSDVRVDAQGQGFSTSGEGTLLYVSGPPYLVTGEGDLVEVGPDGETSVRESGILPYFDGGLSISAEGSYLAVTRLADSDSLPDIWVKELPDGAFRRLTESDSADYRPQWSPDERYVTFVSDRDGASALYRRRVDGGVPAELVHTVSDGAVTEGMTSPDGGWLAVGVDDSEIRVYRTGSSEPTDVIAEAGARWFAISPNGRWIAYTGYRGGTPQVSVRPFPNVSGGDLVQVSIDGGRQPFWNRDADELFFRRGNALTRVSYTADSVFRPGAPEDLLDTAGLIGTSGYFWLAPLPGGTRFLTLAPAGGRLWEFGQAVLERNSWREAGTRAGGR
jgi:serine/threonine-protein kinase